MIQRYKWLFAIALCFSVTRLAQGFWAVVGVNSVGDLVTNAQAVVVGNIVSGMVTDGLASFTIDVERSLKGSIAPRTLVEVRFSTGTRSTSAMRSERGLFFLRQENGWVMIPTSTGQMTPVEFVFFSLPPTSAPTVAGVSIIENVLLELAAALQAGGGRPSAGVFDLAREYRRAPSPALKNALQQFALSSSPQLKRIGFQALLSTGDVATLALFEREHTSMSEAMQAASVEGLKFYFTNPAPEAVALLGRLVSNDRLNISVRQAAGNALARVHTRQALLFLAPLLDSPDVWLRAIAISGLSRFANNVPIGDSTPAAGEWKYRTDETIAYSGADARVAQDPIFVNFWKSWWERHRSELTAE